MEIWRWDHRLCCVCVFFGPVRNVISVLASTVCSFSFPSSVEYHFHAANLDKQLQTMRRIEWLWFKTRFTEIFHFIGDGLACCNGSQSTWCRLQLVCSQCIVTQLMFKPAISDLKSEESWFSVCDVVFLSFCFKSVCVRARFFRCTVIPSIFMW